MDTLELLVERCGDRTRLRSPEVGFFAGALPAGSVLVPGQIAGTIQALGCARFLIVPEHVGAGGGGGGRIVSVPTALARAPVGYGDVVYEIEAVVAGTGPGAPAAGLAPAARGSAGARALVLRSPQTGRFYHRPAPSEPPFVSPGQTIEEGQPVGMIEVMKTFSHIPYRAAGLLPARARVQALVAGDGADVKQGDALLELEPA